MFHHSLRISLRETTPNKYVQNMNCIEIIHGVVNTLGSTVAAEMRINIPYDENTRNSSIGSQLLTIVAHRLDGTIVSMVLKELLYHKLQKQYFFS